VSEADSTGGQATSATRQPSDSSQLDFPTKPRESRPGKPQQGNFCRFARVFFCSLL
jgi:hypothetical protein